MFSVKKAKKVISGKERGYGYIEIGDIRIPVTDGWKEKLSEVIRMRTKEKIKD